ncbi:MAG TPA: TlpA disulfide reductase family protein [Candidatus Binatia bacterium]|nr:TlpA disulfide reductase family protein [Candidatus Binatia bacterium]
MTLFLLLLALPVALASATGAEEPPSAVLDLPLRDAKGAATTLRAVVGDGPALVSFWATYCLPCRADVPVLHRAAARWRRTGLRVVAVAVDVEDPDRVARIAASWGIDYPSYVVPPAQLSRAADLAPRGLPATFVVSRDGVTRHDGAVGDGTLETLLAPRLPAPSAPPPR